MPIADPPAAGQFLRVALQLLEEHDDARYADNWDNEGTRHQSVVEGQLLELASGLAAIAKASDTGLNEALAIALSERAWENVQVVVRVLVGAIEGADRISTIVGPQGPQLAAERLHEWVWVAAERRWSVGHRRDAVQAAGSHVETQLRAKTGQHSGPSKNLADAFKTEAAKPGEVRLRLPGYEEPSDAFTSAHQGAQNFGRGCFQAIRNLASHDTGEIPEQEALEYLAALSVFARWVDVAEVVQAPT